MGSFVCSLMPRLYQRSLLLTGIRTLWASSRRLHLAVRLLWRTTRVGNGRNAVAHGRNKNNSNNGQRLQKLGVEIGELLAWRAMSESLIVVSSLIGSGARSRTTGCNYRRLPDSKCMYMQMVYPQVSSSLQQSSIVMVAYLFCK